MKLRFLGAAKTVTGSCYYVETGKTKFLVDCGMYQGTDVENRNLEPFNFDPTELDFIILTHAHIDHSGLIPKLFRNGFRGNVYLTPQTGEITKILLLDSAKIQEKESDEFNLKDKQMIYGTDDALAAIDKFESVNILTPVEVNKDVKFQFIPAGHVLGASSIFVEMEGKSIIFSGDLGRTNQSIIKNFLEYEEKTLQPTYIISESLYGNSLHPNREESVSNLIEIINKTLARDGNVIIPSFALHRTQEICEILKFAKLAKEISPNVQIYLDSPMGIAVTQVYTNNSFVFNSAYLYKDISIGFDGQKLQDKRKYSYDMPNASRLQFDDLRFVRKSKKSLKLLNKKDSIIIAGSGMAEGGRIIHHLYNGLENSKNSVIFVGFQAVDTLGRHLVDGDKKVTIMGEVKDVKAEIQYLKGFSAHGDNHDLKTWLNRYKSEKLQKVFLIHAEVKVLEDYAADLTKEGYNVEVPDLNQEFIL